MHPRGNFDSRAKTHKQTDLGVQRGLGEEHGVFLGRDSKLIVKGVVPNLLHVVPVGVLCPFCVQLFGFVVKWFRVYQNVCSVLFVTMYIVVTAYERR